MDKLDLTKVYKSYFTAKTTPELVHIEPAQYISICGNGDPSDAPFARKTEALYTTAYTLKFLFKAVDYDFVVSKLEGLWWFDEKKYAGKTITTASVDVPRADWKYRLLIRLPDFIKKKDLAYTIETVVAKKQVWDAVEIEFYTMTEGKAVQMLHMGSFGTEPQSLTKMGEFMEANHLSRNGLHHEIYLSDFRKTAPDKLKTILREPVK